MIEQHPIIAIQKIKNKNAIEKKILTSTKTKNQPKIAQLPKANSLFLSVNTLLQKKVFTNNVKVTYQIHC
jgi:hypothetical protein